MLPRRLLTTAAPALRLATRQGPAFRHHSAVIGRRWNSSSPEPSAYSSFFKTFGRPIFKVCLMAIFTYQLVFFGWSKLEQDEIRSDKQAEITALETKVKELQEGKKA
ncbi:hypothetical protein SPBR_09226 [Sporothrix brasiliensis 5110]|uniref:Uncharacterized protein n=1 Tax=Sporothrix brasiliensis 5110 TaxID=1398154 RepID=A0A0C2F5U6_9PEZI|nr:uncharacterized protein SPBR_09226 [Sporothrix brasiliensis 5110]KIH94284.1 hypothetical protein SPBR_09226 [Sporothrix brasiliensis 5110]